MNVKVRCAQLRSALNSDLGFDLLVVAFFTTGFLFISTQRSHIGFIAGVCCIALGAAINVYSQRLNVLLLVSLALLLSVGYAE